MTEPNTLSCTICTKVTPVQVNYNGKNYCIDHVPNTDTLDEQMLGILNKLAFSGAGMHDKEGWTVFPLAVETAKQQLKALFTEHGKQLLLSLPVSDYEDDDDTWFEYISLESRDKLIAQLKRNKGEDNE